MKNFLLNESNRDNMLLPYVQLCRERGIDMSVSQMKQILLAKFVNEANIRNLSLASNYYLAGVARYYFNGDLTENKELGIFNKDVTDVFNRDICQRLSALILILRNSLIDSVGTTFEQPEDFGELSLKRLLRKYGAAIDKELGIERPKRERKKVEGPVLDENPRVGNGYTFDILYSYNDARKYNRYTEPGAWCITYGEHHYNAYIRRLDIHYVIFLKDGYENVPRQKGPNWTERKPQDEYGNSMIALLQSNVNGEPVYITSRWNHGTYNDNTSCEADHAYTKEEFLRTVGMDDSELQRIFKIWNANREKVHRSSDGSRKELNAERLSVLRQFKYAQMRINGGDQNPFDDNEISRCVAFTNIEKLKTNKEKALAGLNELQDNGASEEEIAAYKAKWQKVHEKFLRDTVRACEIRLNEGKYMFLMDKNKILFETIVKAESGWDSIQYHFWGSESDNDSWSNKARYYKNIVVCEVVNGFMLYNTRLHEFVTVGDKKKFKFITELGRYDVESGHTGFYEVKMSGSQMALIDYNTNRPLKLPNGSCWFESINYPGQRTHYGRDVRTDFVDSNANIIQITYDSASGEEYLFDTNAKTFITPEPEEFRNDAGQIIEGKPELANIGKNRCGIYAISWMVNGSYGLRVKLYKNGKPLKDVNPDSGFKAVRYWGNGVFGFQYNDKKVIAFDAETMRSYPSPLEFGDVGYDRGDDDTRMGMCGASRSRYCIFDTLYKRWLKNPITNDYIFEIYTSSRYSNTVKIYTNREEDYSDRTLLKLKDDAPEFEIEQEHIRENKIIIDKDDIMNMVKESINRIQNRPIQITESDINYMVRKALTETLFPGLKRDDNGNYISRYDDDGNVTDEYIKARWEDKDFDDYEKGDEEEDMWDAHGNGNLEDTNGLYGMMAQGDEDDDATKYARAVRSTDDETYDAYESNYIKESVKRSFNKIIKNK